MRAFDKLEFHIDATGVFDADCLSVLLGALSIREIQVGAESTHLLLLIDFSNDLLTAQQRAKLRTKLEEAYTAFTDPASLIKMIEMIVDYSSCDKEAHDSLQSLSRRSSGAVLEIVPTGLVHFVENCSDLKLLDRVIELVYTMKKQQGSESPRELEIARNRIVKRRDKRG